eukprot:CAMPEP_0195523240 /NCGR_PEP_ID=MMETSP0794_2-20130614/22175_1 /TAXON_ID=515487 /ORGANISM="Stephanopyxis turris, Strain CCMP 815" /LENGTH=157 /DNA_ID=CAMNT_0040653179 /DNA_START=281 /DNA_END=754 /DNA_ORIENTATION=-
MKEKQNSHKLFLLGSFLLDGETSCPQDNRSEVSGSLYGHSKTMGSAQLVKKTETVSNAPSRITVGSNEMQNKDNESICCSERALDIFVVSIKNEEEAETCATTTVFDFIREKRGNSVAKTVSSSPISMKKPFWNENVVKSLIGNKLFRKSGSHKMAK